MATFASVSTDIAERIASGELAAGDQLPGIRGAAQRYGTTTATIARAYRQLASAGVIDVADRRRSRVATGGDAAARRMLDGSRMLRLAGSDDPGLDIALRSIGTSVAVVGERGSFHGLTGIWRGTAEAAAIHLSHRSGVHNAPFARAVLRDRQPAVIHLWRREQGLLVPEGNPGGITGPGDLRELRVARRQQGTGTRVLLDQLLAGVAPGPVIGPEVATHLEVAMAIACGQADTGLGVRSAATALGLGFIPVTWEEFDIVLSADSLPAAEPLIGALRDPAVQSPVYSLGGYDVSRTGTVQLLG